MKKIYYNQKKTKSIALIIGESTGVDCLKQLIDKKYISISYVICSDKKYENLVRTICKKNNIFFYSKKLVTNNFNKLKNLSKKSDLLVSIYSNIILNKRYLEFFKFKCFNIHPGILPYYPGKNCVSGSIFNKEKYIGSSIHLMTTKIDSGDIILIKKTSLSKNDSLLIAMNKLRNTTKDVFEKFIKIKLNKKKISLTKNNPDKIKKFPKYIPNNGKLNQKWDLDFFYKLFKAGDSGPFKSEWGRINFSYKKQKKEIRQIISVKKSKKKQKIFKVTNEKFQIWITDYKILVKAF